MREEVEEPQDSLQHHHLGSSVWRTGAPVSVGPSQTRTWSRRKQPVRAEPRNSLSTLLIRLCPFREVISTPI